MLFDHFPLQRMFDHEQSQPMKKIVVIKASQIKSQQGFQLLQVDTNHMTPTKKSIEPNRRYQSERIEKRSIRCAMYSQKKEFENQPQRSQKGLRNLSLKVKDIVIEMRSTSYKDVAERLIQELGQECRHSELENSKDEQNIKRRVYDALNVMIASGVLRKEGKKVLSDVYLCQKGKSKKNEKEIRKEELSKLQRSVTEKKKRLSELFTKVLSLHNLVERNQNQPEAQHKFQFPILIFQENPQKTKLTMEQRILKIMSQKKLLMYADLDILVQMEMYQKNPELIKEMPNNMFQHLVGPISQVCDQLNN